MVNPGSIQRKEIVRLISCGLEEGRQTKNPSVSVVQAETMLDSYIKIYLDEVVENVVFKAFSNTKISELMTNLNSNSNSNYINLEKKISNLSSLRLQVTTSFITALLITIIILVAKRAGLPIDLGAR